jgi:hypothetical protein
MLSRKILFAILAVLLLGVIVPGAWAQSAPINATDVTLQSHVTVNQCSAGEPVALNGIVHVEFSVNTDQATGANLFSVTAANNLTGVGQTTTSPYVAADSADYTFSSAQSSTDATVELKSDLTPSLSGQGTTMTLVQQLHITVDTSGSLSVSVLGSTSTCGGN